MKYKNPAQFGRIDPKDWLAYPEHYTQVIWSDSLPHDPGSYGDNTFHGRTHPEIIWVALQRYTRPGDVVWDCFAGGGTTIDVCEELDCRCIASDLNPTKPGIVRGDARQWQPDEDVDLAILHPPYLDVVQWGGDGTLAVGDVEDWVWGMEYVIDNVAQRLKLWHVLVLIVGQVYKDGEVLCLDCELYHKMREDFRLLGRIVRGFGETKGGNTAGKRNENLWKYRRLKSGLWALGIDTVTFWQRVS